MLPFEETDLDKGDFKTLRERLTFSRLIKSGNRPTILGLDTETFTDAGLLCVADSDGRYLTGDRSLSELFRFLSSHGRNIYFCWNLSFDAMILLRGVPFEFLREVYLNEDVPGIEFDFEDIHVKYLYRKALELSAPHKTVRIYDASQLYGKLRLQTAGEKFLGRGKVDVGEKRFVRGEITPERQQEIVKYCIEDSRLCRDLASKWVETFAAEFGYYPSRFYSAGAIISEYIFLSLPRFPTFVSVPYPIQTFAYAAYFGGRFEIFKRGTFKNVYHYDINSAYPHAIANMPDFTEGEWFDWWTNPDDYLLDPHTAGFFDVEANIPLNEPVGPFMFRIGTKVICPVGRFRTFATLAELRRVPPAHYSVKEGWVFVPKHPGNNPLSDLIRDMYGKRIVKDTEEQRTVYKVLMNSVYGKTAQVKPRVGKLFSPVLAAYITGYARGMLLDAALKAKDRLIALATDAVFSQVPLDLPTGADMGFWTEKQHETFTIFMNGVYFLDGKPKTRGFSPEVEIDGKKVRLSADLVKVALSQGKPMFKIRFTKPNSLLDSLRRGLNIGEFAQYEREIDLNADTKRIWSEPLLSLEGSHNSYPIPLGG